MSTPFPGMDPYLEHPSLWPGVHLLLIAALAESLTPRLRPKYAVSVEVRLYETREDQALLVGIPDVAVQHSGRRPGAERGDLEIATPQEGAVALVAPEPVRVTLPMPIVRRQGYLEIRDVATREVITAIELLSPVNKKPGRGRKDYEEKRDLVLGSSTHLVEIDLLRSGAAMDMAGYNISSDYRILVSRSEARPVADLYPFGIRQAIPPFPLPLRAGEAEPIVDLQELLHGVYDRGGYDLKLDYSQPALPALAEGDRAWADDLLAAQGLRG